MKKLFLLIALFFFFSASYAQTKRPVVFKGVQTLEAGKKTLEESIELNECHTVCESGKVTTYTGAEVLNRLSPKGEISSFFPGCEGVLDDFKKQCESSYKRFKQEKQEQQK